jgi:hypothetical protein
MNVSITVKGLAQFEVTAEYATPDETKENLAKAIDNVRAVCAKKGLTLVSAS